MNTQRGFTIAELVIVMVVVGVLSAVALPRLFDQSEFAARGGRDFLASGLRYAQKSAIAMRRNVCLDIAGSTVAATIATAPGSDQSCNAGAALVHPANNLAFADPANALPGGAAVTASASVIFDAAGRPLTAPAAPLAAAMTISVAGHPVSVTIEPETGLVH
ncbi:MAG TPA: prepilin-type N-terminal cleavage/methylation domain-containing protein [Caldimonas sp.]|nr:prepilin-type N-terminal cleavage/methylation domain-containing protein [Caldimonas sp.]